MRDRTATERGALARLGAASVRFGFGLAAAILVDVTIVRALLLPSAMRLVGRWNWWLPDGVARLARVEPSPLQPATAPAGGGWPERGAAVVREHPRPETSAEGRFRP